MLFEEKVFIVHGMTHIKLIKQVSYHCTVCIVCIVPLLHSARKKCNKLIFLNLLLQARQYHVLQH